MRGKSKMAYPMEKALSNGAMVTSIRDNGNPIKCMEKAYFAMQREKSMKVNSETTLGRGKEFSPTV